jgi:predicted murein hydrolase (TIGR00659 family)
MKMPSHIEMWAAACLALTMFSYLCAKVAHRRWRRAWLTPVIAAAAPLIAFLLLTKIPYTTYFADTRWLLWLSGPATIAFAIPIYDNRSVVRGHWVSLLTGAITSTVVAVTSSIWLAHALSLSTMLQKSLAARSVTTPMAIAASQRIGGVPDLTVLFVMATGLIGILLGDLILASLPIRSTLARGMLWGSAAHTFGSAQARSVGEQEGVVASLAVVLSGVLTVTIAPLVPALLY